MSRVLAALAVVALGACRARDPAPSAGLAAPAVATSATATASAMTTAAPSPAALAATENTPATCPPTTILADGKPMKIGAALATRLAPGVYQLTVSTRAITCRELLTGAVEVKHDEVSFIVGTGTEAIQRHVDFRNHLTDANTTCVTTPTRPGDPIAVCVPTRVEISGRLPMSNDPPRTIVVEGLVQAKYCGELR